ncbi:MAG: DUF3842 family protein [Oscillospiraceae bacterium]|nr:DUF3842 family protein [Oscillospiraceae bacterium]
MIKSKKIFKILVIDGQGGGIGRSITENIKHIKQERSGVDFEIAAAGTNSAATAAMLKGGADIAATGENAIIYNAKTADIITGAVGICFANSMRGEISPLIAGAVCESGAVKILVPVLTSKCNINIMGISEKPMAQYIAEAAEKIIGLCSMRGELN